MLRKIYRLLSSLLFVGLIISLSMTSQSGMASPLPQTQATATVLIDRLNVRAGPGGNFASLGSVKRGDLLTVLGQTGNCRWLQVRTPQASEGWVAGGSSLIKLSAACNTIPVATVVTSPSTAPPTTAPPTTAPPTTATTPTISAPAPIAADQLGVDFGAFAALDDVVASDFPVAKAMGATWSRIELPWLKIEPTRGALDWRVYDASMQRAKQLGVRVLAVIHSPPTWAAPESCGPIADTAALTTFVKAAVTRYRGIAYAWEFINEPDGKAPLPKYGPTIGCWGAAPDQYAKQLALFYKTVKAQAPNTLVLFGSLAYDNWTLFEREFFGKALANGAGAYFDGVGIHFYPINPVEFPSIRDKISAIRTLLNQASLKNKQIWITETSMWTNDGTNGESQKDYIVREQTRALCNGAAKLFWFAVRQEGENPPLHRWLIDFHHQPAQGYTTYQHYASQIQGRSCQGPLANLPGDVEGYRWTGSGKPMLFVLWSNSKATKQVTLPGAAATVINRSGIDKKSVAAQNGALTVEIGSQPVFVVIER